MLYAHTIYKSFTNFIFYSKEVNPISTDSAWAMVLMWIKCIMTYHLLCIIASG